MSVNELENGNKEEKLEFGNEDPNFQQQQHIQDKDFGKAY